MPTQGLAQGRIAAINFETGKRTMSLDEALAVHEYLKHRAPGGRSEKEELAYLAAWRIICRHAEDAIINTAH